ncbi:MAG TPA: SdiA-regulated domain-containing protein [Bacteroidales bacterium]|nr:SdiA-regulated domain-containing protein [Bacteroidales bacterium]
MIFNFKILLLILAMFNGCKFSNQKENEATDHSITPDYQLDLPDTVWQLPAELREISGLACLDGTTIAAVQDEDARIYLLDKSSGEIISVHDFGKKGDYEGIEMVDSAAWVLKSSGNLYRVENFRQPHPVVTKFKTPLTSANNAEGLAYDPETHSLLIACKGKPYLQKDEKHKGFKAIYSFDLNELKLRATPVFLIDLSVIEAFRTTGAIRKFYVKATKKSGLISDAIFFEPSGIAIHPQNNQLYVISHTAKLLLVINREGEIVEIKMLPPKHFNQPEGICFTKDGTLYISNEGGKGSASILRFKPL